MSHSKVSYAFVRKAFWGASLVLLFAAQPARAEFPFDGPGETPPAKARKAAKQPTAAKPAPAAPSAPRKTVEPAQKQPNTSPLKDGPLRVQIVRSALPGCEPNCLEWISVEGRIDAAGRIRLAKVVAKLGGRKLPIFIDSAGGSGDDGIAMGRLARKHGLDVVVAKTKFEPCATGDEPCRKRNASGVQHGQVATEVSKCLSACAFVLAGGARRFVGPTSFVGLHDVATYSTRQLVRTRYRVIRPLFGQEQKQILSREVVDQKRVRTKTADSTYVEIAGFIAEMGIGQDVMAIIHKTPHEKIHILTLAELERTQLATMRISGRALETGIQDAKATAAAVQPVPIATSKSFMPPAAPGAPPCLATAGMAADACSAAGVTVTGPASGQ